MKPVKKTRKPARKPTTRQRVTKEAYKESEWLVHLLREKGFSPAHAMHALLSAIMLVFCHVDQKHLIEVPLEELMGEFTFMREREIEGGMEKWVQ